MTHRPIANAPRGPHRSIRALQIGLSSLLGLVASVNYGCNCTEPRTTIPVYHVPYASSPPTVDGRLDDAIWQSAPATETFVNTMTGGHADPEASARLAYNDDALFIAFDVNDEWLRATGEGHDPHLWEQDTVEVMVDPDGDGRNYFEMQLSPANAVFDTRYDARRVPQPFGHVDWDSHLEGAAHVRGRVNDDDSDDGYTAELAIPWTAFQAGTPPSGRPQPGDEWRVALYVLDIQSNGQRGLGWSPPMVGDFHVPDRFGRIIFDSP